MGLLPLLKQRIAREGDISVATYMEMALTHPEFGYYTTREPFGTQGDFTTAPEISQVFGELVGAWLAIQWQNLGSPARASLMELGPGRGTLMRDALRATKNVPGFHDAIDLHFIETSPRLQQLQRKAVAHPRAFWHRNIPHEKLSGMPLFFIANEFFDALPIHQLIHRNGKTLERKITLQDDMLVFTVEADGSTRETCPAGEAIVQELSAHLARHGGAGLVMDYGYTGPSRGDTLQAVRNHAYVPPLDSPGEADLTAHVAFDVLAKTARATGAHIHGPIPQGTFLKRLGAELRTAQLCRTATPAQAEALLSGLERLVSPAQMGELFKVLAVTAAPDAPEGF